MQRPLVKRRYSVNEAANLLGRTPGEVRRMLANGEIAGEKVGDKQRSHWWIAGEEIERLLGPASPVIDEARLRRLIHEEVASIIGAVQFVAVVGREGVA